ncbi:class D sortase [Mesobacillus subterraneus]|uniref:Class D sortase n=1 Tax=Mesobacillus subterraneus TaxID=285983 RepID=A0A427TSZ4_9BACI|nr:class D sortase [Mesobacillus subterraneus]RSD27565.1 class D sortase [Mesobacillus subterraneus]
MNKKILSAWMVLMGLSIFFYPAMKDYYTSYNQEKMIEKWEDNDNGAAASLDELEKVFSMETQAETIESEEEKQDDHVPAAVETKQLANGMVGVIEIDKIGLQLPVLNGASMTNLDHGAGVLEGTPMPGMPGNSAIAAHRSRGFGKMFNRLDEIGTGDTVTVRDKNNTYVYEVYDTVVVEPDDISVLNGSEDEKTLTLITCTPIDTATHRLIVKARIRP